MLKSWTIKNFKAIVDSGALQLAPVTILAGRNSSGKSSLLQSILMVAQTLSSKPDRALSPNGTLIQLGTFRDFINDSSHTQNISLEFELSGEREDIGQNLIDLYRTSNYNVSVLFSVDNDSSLNRSAIESSKIFMESILLDFSLISESSDPNEKQLGQEKLRITTSNGKFTFNRVSENALQYIMNEPAVLTSLIGRYALYHGALSLQEHIYDIPKDVNGLFFLALSHFLPSELKRGPNDSSVNVKDAVLLPDVNLNLNLYLDVANEDISQFFTSKIRYLGPLRAEPSLIQQKFASTGDFDDVGIKGEYTAVVYHSNRSASIEYYNPLTMQIEQDIFHHALDNWVSYLGVANQIKTEQAGQEGISWRITHQEGQKPRSLASVGVGVSQILPMLVMGLLSPKGSLLIIEQPELHLHPAVQARLGDFFMGLAKCNKQCLIETHSENLVSQLRYHIVQAGGQEQSDCMIYFVDQDEQGAAKFEQVQISPQGNILNWPDGFFDETMLQEDRITAASIKKRAKSAKNVVKNGQ